LYARGVGSVGLELENAHGALVLAKCGAADEDDVVQVLELDGAVH